jgi:hypothetical protein
VSVPPSSKIAWPKLGIEAVTIVVSILLAFAVEEWREDSRDRDLEREYLTRLVEDLDANVAEAGSKGRAHARQVANARAVYPLVSRGNPADLNNAAVVAASYNASPSAIANWVDDTFEELKSTGRLSLIRSTDIRQSLLAYYRFLETQDWAYELMSTAYRDAIRARMDPDLQLQIRSQCASREVGCQVDINDNDIEEYLDWLTANQELGGGLRRVIVQWTRAGKYYLPAVKERSVQLKRLIEEALDK